MLVKLLHTSDLHLGNGFQGLDPTKRRERREDLFKVFKKIVQTAKEQKVDALLIVGDLFDRFNPPIEVVKNAIEILEDLKSIPTIIVPGNHDPISPRSVYKTASFPDNVTLITKTEFEAIDFQNFVLYAAAYDQRKPDFHPLKKLKVSESDKPIIVAVHGSYIHSGSKWKENLETGDYWPIEPSERSRLRNISYLALGHYHNFYVEKSMPYTCYPGTPEGLSFSESGDRFVSIVNIDDITSVEKISLSEKRHQTLDIDCTKITDEKEIEKRIEEKFNENTLLHVRLKGVLSPDIKLNPNKLKERFEDQFFHLDVTADIHLPEMKFPSHTVKGIYVRILQNRLKQARTERERHIIHQAIRYGLAALDDYL